MQWQRQWQRCVHVRDGFFGGLVSPGSPDNRFVITKGQESLTACGAMRGSSLRRNDNNKSRIFRPSHVVVFALLLLLTSRVGFMTSDLLLSLLLLSSPNY